ncbi:ATP-dependent DNA helicase [Cryptococcus deuterogattii 99/473]|uniref:ATP-dependent DNA helicase n=1 Tax=Cryptococcus deuterogattii Ram5 TaxID=1296110 RepID=A0A0D0SXW0_9TREE|nr:ATP-dependent DNA helicase [Cryptococcus deuterogattii Ram5]KIY54506.1 ATP-dependent DNA helicase [Cryptococcus deuterogattii 99/473]
MLAFPSSTPAEKPYINLVNSTQFARNNFRPTKREWRRTMSPQETPSALQRNLKHYWGYNVFRHPQLEICTDALRGCDLIVVAPTGLGKSLCFQLPAITIEHGVTIVVSPLKALMSDQVKDLTNRGIKAVQLSEYTTLTEHNEVRRQMRMGHPEIRLLYVTPEMLLSDKHRSTFDTAYAQKQIARLVVDEAHVITEWGTSFRSKYRELGKFRERYYDIPITALTASATKEVRHDIIQTLQIRKGYGQWVMPFNRRNLFYEIRYQGRGSVEEEEREIQMNPLDDMADFIEKYRPEAMKRNQENGIFRICVTGIVYCRTTAATAKDQALAGWKDGSIECIVATIAFGMGIDQANVRYIIHYQMPKTFEGYYQETGRAGRDGHISHCLMYYSREDAKYLKGLVEQEDAKQKRNARFKSGDAYTETSSQTLNSFKALQHYMERVGRCRHVGICSYFGEKIDDKDPEIKAAYCQSMCDVCRDNAKVRKAAMNLTDSIPIASAIDGKEPTPIPDQVPESQSFFNPQDNEDTDTDTDEPFHNELLDLHDPDPDIFEESLAGTAPPIFQIADPRFSGSHAGNYQNTPVVPSTNSHLQSSNTTSSNMSSKLPSVPLSRTPVLVRDLSSEHIAQPIRVREIIHIETGGEPGPQSLANKRRRTGQGSLLSSSPTSSMELEEIEREREREMAMIGAREERERQEAMARERKKPIFSSNTRLPSNVELVQDSEEGTASELKLTREQRMKAERMLNSVKPVRGEGPYACYNAAPPMARFRKVSSASDKTFKPPILKSPNKVRCDLLTKSARDNALLELSNSLKDSLSHGNLARTALSSWGRFERGSKRITVLQDVARAIERDFAAISREDPLGFERRITEFRKATKAFRSAEVVSAIAQGDIDSFDDGGPEMGHLKSLEKYMRRWKPKPTE